MADGEMSHLKQLMLADDDEPETMGTEGAEGERTQDVFEDDGPVRETPLGNSIHALCDRWTDLLKNVAIRVQEEPTQPEHIKEQAEISVKNFRDACLDVITEFTKVGAAWARAYPEDAYREEEAGLQEATTRQTTLIARTHGSLMKKASDLKTVPNEL